MLFLERKYHDQHYGLQRASEARCRTQSRSGNSATADPSQSAEACRQAEPAAEVKFCCDGSGSPAECRASFQGGSMTTTTRFGRKLKLPSTTQIKHQLLVMWLADQTEKEAAEAKEQKEQKADLASVPMHVHEATF